MPSYTYVTADEPSAGTTATAQNDINNLDQTVGYFSDGFGTYGFFYDGGVWTTLDNPLSTNNFTFAAAINDSGQVVGNYDIGSNGFLYSDGVYTTIRDPLATGACEATGINNAGDIVGTYEDATGYHGFLYSGGVYTTLDAPLAVGFTTGARINDLGQITGTYNDASGVHAFLYSMGTWTTLDAPMSASYTTGGDINNLGEITGVYVDVGGNAHSYLYSNGIWTDIANPAGTTYVRGNNDAGVLVGVYTSPGAHGFIAMPDNTAPTITSNGGGATAALSIAENATVVTTVAASDPNSGQALAYSLAGGDDMARFTIGSTSGLLAFATGPDFESPSDVGHDNVYEVVVQVSDGHGGSDTQALAVTITNQAGEIWAGGNSGQSHTGTGEEDILTGGNGKDVIDGAAGNDSISGGNGKDILMGGAGNDVLTGGNGADTFVFAAGFGNDLVTDFSGDTIRIDRGLFADFSAVMSHAAEIGSDTVITYDASNTITLQGVALSSLHAGGVEFF